MGVMSEAVMEAREQLLGPRFWFDKSSPPPEPPLAKSLWPPVEVMMDEIWRLSMLVAEQQYAMAEEQQAVAIVPVPGKRGRGRPKGTSAAPKVAAPAPLAPLVPPIFLNVEDVSRITTLCKSDIYDAIAAGTFPKQFQIGLRRVAWLYRDIIDWAIEREHAAREGRQAVWPPPWRESID
jgi:predicted DNA-binding transcriptional regulator AlpA